MSAQIPYVSAEELQERLPWSRVIEALDNTVGTATRDGQVVDRSVVQAPGGQLLLMPAVSHRAVGVKVVGVGHDNNDVGMPRIHAVYLLLDADHLSPRAIIDGETLTTRRTAGHSAMVVQRFAPAQPSRLVVFGSGPQAEGHVEAIGSIRQLTDVSVVARRSSRVEVTCARLRATGTDAHPGTVSDVEAADIVVCATTATEPLFDGKTLPDNCFIVAVGSHTPDARELDDVTFRRASRVLVEHLPTALREAGDIIQAVAAGALDPRGIQDLGDVAGQPAGRQGITVFKSVGMGYQDLAVIEAAMAVDEMTSGTATC